MNKTITTLVAIVAIFMGTMLAAKPVMAGSYDGPDIRKDISVNKRVGLPTDKGGNVTYVDNISADTYTFDPRNAVFFEIRVKNTSNVDLIGVKLSDFEPAYFELFENPGVLVDGNVLKIEAGDFDAGEEKVFIVRGRILDHANVPSGTTCITNRVRAEASGVSDEDTAQFCFETGEPTPTPRTVVTKGGVTTTESIPSTGPEHTLAIMALSSVLGYVGLRLKKAA